MGWLIAGSELPKPHGSPHIGHALYVVKTAVTGTDITGWLILAAFLVLAGLVLIFAGRADRKRATR